MTTAPPLICPRCRRPAHASGCAWCGWHQYENATWSPPATSHTTTPPTQYPTAGHSQYPLANQPQYPTTPATYYPATAPAGYPTAWYPPYPYTYYGYRPPREPFLRISGRWMTWAMLTLVGLMFITSNLVALLYAVVPVLRQMAGLDHFLDFFFPHTPLTEESAQIHLTGAPLQLYGALVFLAVIVSLGWVFYREVPRLLQRSVPPSATELALGRRGALPVLAGCWAINLLVSICFAFIGIFGGGSSPVTPDFEAYDPYELLFLLANAAVWEEVTYRIVALGLPLGLWHLVSRNRNTQPWYRYLLGGGFHKADTALITLALLSSAYFGYAHVAGGWGWWKLFPSAFAGLLMAWLFLRWGLTHAITFHFLIDYSSALEILSSGGELPWVLFPFRITAFIAFLSTLLLAIPMLCWLMPAYVTGLVQIVTDLFGDPHEPSTSNDTHEPEPP